MNSRTPRGPRVTLVGTVALRLAGRALVAALLLATPVVAQPRDPAAAEALFLDGRKAAAAGDQATACARFRESQRLDPAIGTVLNIAICEEALGQLASAWQHYQECAQGLPPGDDRQTMARVGVERLEKRAPRLTLALAPGAVEGTRVERDGIELSSASFGVALPVDPGNHSVLVLAPGHEPRSYALSLREAQRETLVVEPGAVSVGAPPVGATTAQPAGVAPQPAGDGPTRKTGSSSKTAGYVIGGIGVAGLLTSAVTGAMVLGKKGVVERECNADKECSQAALDAGEAGKTLSTVSTIAFAVGAVGVGVGAYLVISSGDSAQPATRVGIATSPGGARLSFAASF